MAWFKKSADGSTDDQSKAEMDAMLAKFGEIVDQRVSEALKPVNEKVSTLSTDWETLKTESSKPAPVDTRPRDEHGNVRDLTETEKQQRLNVGLAEQTVQMNARWTERDAIDAIHPDFKHLAPQIREMFTNTPIARKAQGDYAEYCNNVVQLAIGREAVKAGLRRKESGEFFLEDRSSGSDTPDSMLNDPSLTWKQETANGVREMSAQEQLRKLGIDPKKFEESAKKGLV